MNENFEEYLERLYYRINETVWTDGTDVFTIDDGAEWDEANAIDAGTWAYSVSNLDETEAANLIIQLSGVMG